MNARSNYFDGERLKVELVDMEKHFCSRGTLGSRHKRYFDYEGFLGWNDPLERSDTDLLALFEVAELELKV